MQRGEAERRIVRRQQRCDVHVEVEQIANGVGVFAAIQSAQCGAAGIQRCGTVELGFEPGAERAVGCGFRTRLVLWRHGPRRELAQHALPHVRVLGHTGGIGLFERELTRELGTVVAVHAIALQHRARVFGRGDGAAGPATRGDERRRDDHRER